MDGYIKLHRKLLESEVFQDDFLTRLWVWCLLKANWQDTGRNGNTIRRGQFRTTRVRASEELNVSPSKWYRGIRRLEDLGCLETEPNSNWTTITICNYTTYQDQDGKSEQQMNSKRTADEQHTIIDEEREEIKEHPQTLARSELGLDTHFEVGSNHPHSSLPQYSLEHLPWTAPRRCLKS